MDQEKFDCLEVIPKNKGIYEVTLYILLNCDYQEIDDQPEKVALHDRGYIHYHKTCFINNMLYDEMKNDTRLSKHVKEVLELIN